MICAYLFLAGSCIGSFLNVCACRIPAGISVVKGRSFCPACKHQLYGRDMVPILSYLLLGRKCRFCGAPISLRYPAAELLTGGLYVLAFLRFDFSLKALAAMAFFSLLLVVALIDADTGEIPDRLSVSIALLAPLYALCPPQLSLVEHLIGAAAVSVPMLLLAYLCGGFGGGDVKLCAACGLALGWRLVLLGAAFAVVAAAAFGVVLLLRHKAGRKTAIPFGPFLSAGMVFAVCCGEGLLQWYASLLA